MWLAGPSPLSIPAKLERRRHCGRVLVGLAISQYFVTCNYTVCRWLGRAKSLTTCRGGFDVVKLSRNKNFELVREWTAVSFGEGGGDVVVVSKFLHHRIQIELWIDMLRKYALIKRSLVLSFIFLLTITFHGGQRSFYPLQYLQDYEAMHARELFTQNA